MKLIKIKFLFLAITLGLNFSAYKSFSMDKGTLSVIIKKEPSIAPVIKQEPTQDTRVYTSGARTDIVRLLVQYGAHYTHFLDVQSQKTVKNFVSRLSSSDRYRLSLDLNKALLSGKELTITDVSLASDLYTLLYPQDATFRVAAVTGNVEAIQADAGFPCSTACLIAATHSRVKVFKKFLELLGNKQRKPLKTLFEVLLISLQHKNKSLIALLKKFFVKNKIEFVSGFTVWSGAYSVSSKIITAQDLFKYIASKPGHLNIFYILSALSNGVDFYARDEQNHTLIEAVIAADRPNYQKQQMLYLFLCYKLYLTKQERALLRSFFQTLMPDPVAVYCLNRPSCEPVPQEVIDALILSRKVGRLEEVNHLMLAAARGHRNLVMCVLEKCLEQKFIGGLTPAFALALYHKHLGIMELLETVAKGTHHMRLFKTAIERLKARLTTFSGYVTTLTCPTCFLPFAGVPMPVPQVFQEITQEEPQEPVAKNLKRKREKEEDSPEPDQAQNNLMISLATNTSNATSSEVDCEGDDYYEYLSSLAKEFFGDIDDLDLGE